MLCVQDMAMCEEAEQMTVQEVEGEAPPSPTSAADHSNGEIKPKKRFESRLISFGTLQSSREN